MRLLKLLFYALFVCTTLFSATTHSHNVDELSAFVLFTGYQRSGSTVLAALLSQHPQIRIAHEYDVLKKWTPLLDADDEQATPNATSLFAPLLASVDADLDKRYYVFNSYNFSCAVKLDERNLRVLGDKKVRRRFDCDSTADSSDAGGQHGHANR